MGGKTEARIYVSNKAMDNVHPVQPFWTNVAGRVRNLFLFSRRDGDECSCTSCPYLWVRLCAAAVSCSGRRRFSDREVSVLMKVRARCAHTIGCAFVPPLRLATVGWFSKEIFLYRKNRKRTKPMWLP